MDPVTLGALIGGGGQGLSMGLDFLGGILQSQSSSAEAEKAREFARKMFRHRYQWTMEDMRLAGLNPILAYQQGGGSPSSSASMGQMPNILTGAASTARGAASRVQELLNLKAQRKVTENQAAIQEKEKQRAHHGVFTEMMAGAEKEQAVIESRARTKREQASAERLAQETRMLKYSEPLARADAAFYESDFGQVMRNVERTMGSAGGVLRTIMGAGKPERLRRRR